MTLNERLEKVLPSKYEVRDVFPNGGTVAVAYYTATDYDALFRAFEKRTEQFYLAEAVIALTGDYDQEKMKRRIDLFDAEVLKAYEGEK